MTRIKRILIIVLLVFSFSYKINAQSNFSLEIRRSENRKVRGVEYKQLTVIMTSNGKKTNQRISYIGANFLTNPELSLVALDNYPDVGFKTGGLITQINYSQAKYPGKIIAAVNGDFFDVVNRYSGTRESTNGPHIRDGNVICEGYQYYRPMSVGVNKDNTPFLGKPEFDGLHIQVFDEEGSLKQKDLPVKVNELPNNDTDLRAFISTFENPSLIEGKKMLIKISAQQIHKRIGGADSGKYFIKGELESITEDEITRIPDDVMVLVGNDFFLENLITENDTVRLQNRPSGAFKDIYHAISGIHPLVENGVVLSHTNVEVHPRTAAGIKEDGTIFFVVVDGRYSPDYIGVTREELGHIMKYFNAKTAFNLDGGGSSTMTVLDVNTETYDIKNRPSEGGLRSNGNGVGFIYGPRNIPLPPVPYPDTRTVLNQVNKIILEGNKLMFNEVENANRYVVTINGLEYETERPELNLDLNPGLYDVNIKAFGEHSVYKQSSSDLFMIEIYSTSMQKIIDELLNYGKKTHEYVSE